MVSLDIWQFGLMPACISYSGELIACWSILVINLTGENPMPNIFLTFSALRWLTPKGTALSSKPESCGNNYLSTFSIQHAWIKHSPDEISSLLLTAAASVQFTPPCMLPYFVLLLHFAEYTSKIEIWFGTEREPSSGYQSAELTEFLSCRLVVSKFRGA